MNPNVWGSAYWKTIHNVAGGYPMRPSPQDKINYRNFYYSLQNVLPCQMCRRNLTKNLAQFPLTDQWLSSRESLLRWTVELHNMVNRELGKPEMSYEDVVTQIEDKMRKVKKGKTPSWFFLIIILVILIIFLVACYFIRRWSQGNLMTGGSWPFDSYNIGK